MVSKTFNVLLVTTTVSSHTSTSQSKVASSPLLLGIAKVNWFSIFSFLSLKELSLFMRSCHSAHILGLDPDVWKDFAKRLNIPRSLDPYKSVKLEIVLIIKIRTCLHNALGPQFPDDVHIGSKEVFDTLNQRKDDLIFHIEKFADLGLVDSIKIILTSQFKHRIHLSTLLCIVASKGQHEVMKVILNALPITEYQREIATIRAITNGHLPTVKVLLGSGSIGDSGRELGFLKAADLSRFDIMKELIKTGPLRVNLEDIKKAEEARNCKALVKLVSTRRIETSRTYKPPALMEV